MILKLPWSPGLYLKHQVHFEFCTIITLYYSRKIPWPPTQNLNIIDVPGSLAELIWVSSGMFPWTVGDVSQWRSWGSHREKHGVNHAVRSGLLFRRIDFPYGSAHSVCEGEHSSSFYFIYCKPQRLGILSFPVELGDKVLSFHVSTLVCRILWQLHVKYFIHVYWLYWNKKQSKTKQKL